MHAFLLELAAIKTASDFTAAQRAEIPKKDFALTGAQSSTHKPAYPIHDERHARLAQAFVKMHGSPSQQSEVYKDVARKYPQLAHKGSGQPAHTKEKTASPSPGVLRRVGENLVKHDDLHEIAGLGTLALPAFDHVQSKTRAAFAGDDSPNAARKRQMFGEDAHAATEIGGLGYLAAPAIARKALGLKGGHG